MFSWATAAACPAVRRKPADKLGNWAPLRRGLSFPRSSEEFGAATRHRTGLLSLEGSYLALRIAANIKRREINPGGRGLQTVPRT